MFLSQKNLRRYWARTSLKMSLKHWLESFKDKGPRSVKSASSTLELRNGTKKGAIISIHIALEITTHSGADSIVRNLSLRRLLE